MIEEVIYYVIGLWVSIILFITCPLWGIPYILYKRIKNR